jgi:glycosyl transferase, family 25
MLKTNDLWVTTINLKKRADRRKFMEDQFRKLGIDSHFTTAIDANSDEFAQAQSVYQLKNTGPWGPQTNGTLACTLSHLKAYKEFLDSGFELALIFEDDAVMSSDIVHWVADTNWMPKSADIVRVEYWNSGQHLVVQSDSKIQLGRRICRLLNRSSGTAGYVIRRSAAQKVLKRASSARLPFDHLLFNLGASQIAKDLKTFQIIPGMVVQSPDLETDIQSHRDSVGKRKNPVMVELRRGIIELKPLQSLIWPLLMGKVKIVKNAFVETTIDGGAT